MNPDIQQKNCVSFNGIAPEVIKNFGKLKRKQRLVIAEHFPLLEKSPAADLIMIGNNVGVKVKERIPLTVMQAYPHEVLNPGTILSFEKVNKFENDTTFLDSIKCGNVTVNDEEKDLRFNFGLPIVNEKISTKIDIENGYFMDIAPKVAIILDRLYNMSDSLKKVIADMNFDSES